jgi:hypothetical protein
MNGQFMDTSPSGQYADQREYVNGGGSYSSSQVRQMTAKSGGRCHMAREDESGQHLCSLPAPLFPCPTILYQLNRSAVHSL